jgi:hypothetical protein
VVCCLSTGGDDSEESACAAEFVDDHEDGNWASFAFMRFADKEALKAQLSFSTLPFCAAFDVGRSGRLLGSGNPLSCDVREWGGGA